MRSGLVATLGALGRETGRSLRCLGQSNPPRTHIGVPTPVVFPAFQVESHIQIVTNLHDGRILDGTVAPNRNTNLARVLALSLKDEFLTLPRAVLAFTCHRFVNLNQFCCKIHIFMMLLDTFKLVGSLFFPTSEVPEPNRFPRFLKRKTVSKPLFRARNSNIRTNPKPPNFQICKGSKPAAFWQTVFSTADAADSSQIARPVFRLASLAQGFR